MTLFGADAPSSGASESQSFLFMLAASALNSAVLMIATASARWRGFKLTATLALEIFGIQFFMSQIETVLFNQALGLSIELVYAIVLGGFVIAAGVAPLTVWLMGKRHGPEEPADLATRSVSDYAWRIALLAVVVYPALYLLAGHFIAWQFAAVRELYTGATANRSFVESLIPFVTGGLWLTQIVRGLMWIGLGLPVLWMTRNGFPRSGVVLGLLFAVLMNAQHLLPNPYMPDMVRLAHAIETTSSNFVWGIVIGWLLTPEARKREAPSGNLTLQLLEDA
jgi:hypothetical protein